MDQSDAFLIKLLCNNRKMYSKVVPKQVQAVNFDNIKKTISNFENDILTDDHLVLNTERLVILLQKHLNAVKALLKEEMNNKP
jgi:hypothetical protein